MRNCFKPIVKIVHKGLGIWIKQTNKQKNWFQFFFAHQITYLTSLDQFSTYTMEGLGWVSGLLKITKCIYISSLLFPFENVTLCLLESHTLKFTINVQTLLFLRKSMKFLPSPSSNFHSFINQDTTILQILDCMRIYLTYYFIRVLLWHLKS